MSAPWWILLAFYFLFATTLIPTTVICYPVSVTKAAAPVDGSILLAASSRPQIFTKLTRRGSPPPKKRTRLRSKSPEAGPSNHHAPSAHVSRPSSPSAGSHHSESSDGGYTTPETTQLHTGPSPGSHKIKNAQKHDQLTSNVKAKKLKSDDYAKKAKEAFPGVDWKGKEADHILEAQTVAKKINKHKKYGINKKCLEALMVPMNHQSNLAPLLKKLNGEVNGAFLTKSPSMTFMTTKMGPEANQRDPHFPLKNIPHFSEKLAQHHLDHKNAMIATAKKVDDVMANKDVCPELQGTPLHSPGGKVEAQARIILDHADKSKQAAIARKGNK
ncbi:hypothetical protein D9619_009926 [Psilocybe cf. subviscida]|uniref:Uncharacterized protein n=1 Tax=Psilocybe cf. subviscida TaxID=2480587 RepID=A0A8H5BKR3_9AGAR|nr:hypothetical protein D9619_009926 [Psilocybe cf. subviscida]